MEERHGRKREDAFAQAAARHRTGFYRSGANVLVGVTFISMFAVAVSGDLGSRQGAPAAFFANAIFCSGIVFLAVFAGTYMLALGLRLARWGEGTAATAWRIAFWVGTAQLAGWLGLLLAMMG